jgi:hypothetical protein
MDNMMNLPTDVLGIHNRLGKDRVDREMKEYYSLFNNSETSTKDNEQKRIEKYDTLATNFYDLVTDFYEYPNDRLYAYYMVMMEDMVGENPSILLQDIVWNLLLNRSLVTKLIVHCALD